MDIKASGIGTALPGLVEQRRSPLALTERFVLDRWRSMAVWAIGLLVYTVLIVSLFPTIRDSAGFAQAAEEYPDALKEFLGGEDAFDLTSGTGYLSAELFNLVLPLLLSIWAIGFGASMGSEQHDGTMDLLLANPIRRWRVVVEKALSLGVTTLGLASVPGLVVLVANGFVALDIDWTSLAATVLAVSLLVVVHGLVALLVGAMTGRRGSAVGAATVLFAAGYLLNGLGGLVSWLEPFKMFSLYYQALGQFPLREGWQWDNLALLLFICGLVTVVAVAVFERRDVG